MRKFPILFITALILLVIIMASIQISKNKEQTSLATDDGYTLSYEFHKVSDKGVILVHMMNRDKRDYNELADKLNKAGFSTIAIDLRGHGKSSGNLKNFKDDDYQNMKYDLKAAKNFLITKKVNKISIVGASIGANLALNYSAGSDITKIVLLSPGENFHNIEVLDTAKNYKGSILMVAAKDDLYSYETVQKLEKIHKGFHQFISYETGGHGTFIILTHPELKENIVKFLEEN